MIKFLLFFCLCFVSASSAFLNGAGKPKKAYGIIDSTPWENITPDDHPDYIFRHKYFEKLDDYHENNDNSCGLVAIQMYLDYFDSYYDDYIISEEFDVNAYIRNVDDLESFNDAPHSTEGFFELLRDIALDNEWYSPLIGMYDYQVYNTLDTYLNSVNCSHSIEFIENDDENYNQNIKRSICHAIDLNEPIIATNNCHVFVIYGYDDNYLYANTGNGACKKVNWSNLLSDNSGASTYRVIFDEHHCSNNHIYSSEGSTICSCGQLTENFTLFPQDFGFESQYYFYEKNKEINLGEYSFNTKRLRCGYIENSFINLSPRRENAGYSYLEFDFNSIIFHMSISLSFWSDDELVNMNNSNYYFEVFDPEFNEWVVYGNIWHEFLISNDRTNQTTLYLTFDKIYTGFRIAGTSIPLGTRNKGRLSIGSISYTTNKIIIYD